MNSLNIIGNLTKDPDKRITSNGISVCSFTVAVNRRREEGTDFFRVTTWRALADICGKYLGKGLESRGDSGMHTYGSYRENGVPLQTQYKYYRTYHRRASLP